MLNEQTLEKLYAMRLNGMADAFREQMLQPDINELSFEERLGFLVDHHWSWREDRRLKTLLRNARLKDNACIEDIDYKSPRGLDKSLILSLSSCDWIKNAQNIIVTGPTGVGKTYIACALANSSCRKGFSVLYIRTPRLFQDISIAKADGSYPKLMNKIAKAKVLIVDNFCITPIKGAERKDLLEVIEDRQGLGSTIISTQIPMENWFEAIGDPTIADAVLDRLIHNAHRINLKGESMRKRLSSLTNKNKFGK
ncbi:MAG: IS21-like element helper ATPase IstB [Desulfobacterales bacterium]|nr:IS21-like element helper ATPase IstB [Desulfobacterales bacterium]